MQNSSNAQTWVPVFDYEDYEISTTGAIRRAVPSQNRPAGYVLRPIINAQGYLALQLSKNAKSTNFLVHRLVAFSFHGAPDKGLVACHNDGNPLNNSPDNLRWDTQKSNAADSRRHGRNYCLNKTHCPSGHPYSGANLITIVKGEKVNRQCATCHREQKTVIRERLKAERLLLAQ
jgi:hypothetical protein